MAFQCTSNGRFNSPRLQNKSRYVFISQNCVKIVSGVVPRDTGERFSPPDDNESLFKGHKPWPDRAAGAIFDLAYSDQCIHDSWLEWFHCSKSCSKYSPSIVPLPACCWGLQSSHIFVFWISLCCRKWQVLCVWLSADTNYQEPTNEKKKKLLSLFGCDVQMSAGKNGKRSL